MKKKVFYLVSILLAACSGNQPEQKKNVAVFPIKSAVIGPEYEDEGSDADIQLSIHKITEGEDFINYKLISSYNNEHIGFLLSMHKKKKGASGVKDSVMFSSIGKESDSFIKLLATLYKRKIHSSAKFTGMVSFDCVNLKSFAKERFGVVDTSSPAIEEYKLFFNGNGGDDYAEVFLNINLKEHWVQLNEKDEEYRTVLIRALRFNENHSLPVKNKMAIFKWARFLLPGAVGKL